jgi:hypothetical protein
MKIIILDTVDPKISSKGKILAEGRVNAFNALGSVPISDPEWLTTYNGSLVGDFGATHGLYSYNGSAWNKISTLDCR